MEFDIVIVGAGLAGASLACALRASRWRIGLVESRPPQALPPGQWDARVYALSPASRRWLEQIGAWPHLPQARIAPVHDMRIRGDRGGELNFSAYDAGVDALAYIAESTPIQVELFESLKRQPNLTMLCPAQPQALTFDDAGARLNLADGRSVCARLVVAADGADSWVRRQAGIEAQVTAYDALGVVANFACARAHHGRAFQWFRDDGVLAWLPLPGERLSMVWSAPEARARELLALAPEALAREVAEAGEHALGALDPLSAAAGFALRLTRVPGVVAPRLVLIGDAAHSIHPLSGHGINLGFKDAQSLAGLLAELPDYCDPGDLTYLRRHERARAEEVWLMQGITHALQRLFAPRDPLLAALRNVGLKLTDRVPVVRNALVRYALG